MIIWKEFDDEIIEHEKFNKLFEIRFHNKFKIYNLRNKKINFKNNQNKIFYFQAPDYPFYLLEFFLTFSVSVKDWVSSDDYIVLIVFDILKNYKNKFKIKDFW